MGAALAIVPPPQSLSLYHLSEDLVMLMDSIDLTEENSPERLECEAALRAYCAELPGRVDAVASMLHHLEAQAEFAKAEIERLQKRHKTFEHRHERLEAYCIKVIELLPEPKRGPRKLDGDHNTLSIRPSDAVIVRDETSISSDYKTVTAEMPAPDWDDVMEALPGLQAKVNRKVRLADIKKALKAGADVPGADLEYRNNLRVS